MECLRLNDTSATLLSRVVRKCKHVLEDNVKSFEVLWRFGEVISPTYHRQYLDDICEELAAGVSRLVANSRSDIDQRQSPVFKEVQHHWLAFRRNADNFFAMEDILSEMESVLVGPTEAPVVLFGEQGSGKSTIMSKLALQVQVSSVFQGVLVVRQIGATLPSTHTQQMISGICAQLLLILGKSTDGLPTNLSELVSLLKDILTYIPDYIPVFIFIDGVDQLVDFNTQFLTALEECCQPNVKLILSLDTKTRRYVADEYTVLECGVPNVDGALESFHYVLGQAGRKVTTEQASTFKEALQSCSLPMFIRTLVELAKNMTSTPHTGCEFIPKSVEDALEQLLEQLEVKHGKEIFRHAMGYVVASVTGLSDCEMEDVLSLDDSVLDSISPNALVTIRRIPPAIWLTIKEDMETFIVQREVDEVIVNCIIQRDIVQAIQRRYLQGDTFEQKLHSVLADYFLGIWAEKEKPIDGHAKTENKMQTAPRYVLSQPLTFQDDVPTVRFNCRKYDQVPRHMFLARRLEELDNLVLFNYEWLYNKTKALSLQDILDDLSLNPGIEVNLVEGTLRMAEDYIRADIDDMVSELIGRLLPYYSTYPKIRALINQCDTDGLKQCPFIPNFPYQQVPGTSLRQSLVTPEPIDSFLVSDDGNYLLTKEKTSCYVNIHDISLGTHVNSIFASDGDLYVTPNGLNFVIVDHETEKTIKIHDSASGMFRGQLIVMNQIELKSKQKYHVGPVCLTNDRICFIVTTDNSYLCVAGMQECEILQIVKLDGKSNACTITPEGNFLFCNSNEYMFTYDILNLQHIGTVPTDCRPTSVIVTNDGQRVYVSCKTKLLVFYLNRGSIELAYRTDVKQFLQDDEIVEMKASPVDNMVLLRGKNNLLVYNRYKEGMCATFPRPPSVPNEFKPPNRHPIELYYTQADFSSDGNRVIGTIFNSIYIWEIATRCLLTKIWAPIGVIQRLRILQDDSIMTNNKNSKDVQVWNTNQSANNIALPDRMGGAIADALTTVDIRHTFLRFKDSDEIGVVDMRTGVVEKLLNHRSKVIDFAITPTGSHLLVSLKTRKKNGCAQVWNVTNKTTVFELGDSPGYCLSLSKQEKLIFVSKKSNSLHAPFSIHSFQCLGALRPRNYSTVIPVEEVFEKPFVTDDDKYVVMVARKENESPDSAPTIFAFSVLEDGDYKSYSPDMFAQNITVDSLIQVRHAPQSPCHVIVLISSKHFLDNGVNHTVVSDTMRRRHMYILDIHKGVVYSSCDLYSNSEIDNYRPIYEFLYVHYTENEDSELPTENSSLKLSCLLHKGSIAIYNSGSLLHACTTTSGEEVAKINVHQNICHISACPDDMTLVVGCDEGSLFSYVFIDTSKNNYQLIISSMPSRQVDQPPSREVTDYKPGDLQINGASSRPSSAMSSASDKERLDDVLPVDKIRPKSDTLLYLNSKSASCSVM
ncbi:hypothetical protein ScPMuIL_006357 [Solemya velum]